MQQMRTISPIDVSCIVASLYWRRHTHLQFFGFLYLSTVSPPPHLYIFPPIFISIAISIFLVISVSLYYTENNNNAQLRRIICCAANEGPVRIQYKCPIYVFQKIKLLFQKQNYNVLSPSSYTYISERDI